MLFFVYQPVALSYTTVTSTTYYKHFLFHRSHEAALSLSDVLVLDIDLHGSTRDSQELLVESDDTSIEEENPTSNNDWDV